MAINLFYGLTANPTRKVPSPAPLVSIRYNPYFAGDNIIGYDYTITLKGYAIANFGATDAHISEQRVIQKVRVLLKEVFDRNGAVLLCKDVDGTVLFRATGSKINSISVESNDNKWVNYANYTVELTFNELHTYTCSPNDLTCPEIVVTNYPEDNLVDISKYKIRSFSDTWDFVIDGKNYQALGEMVRNEHFNIAYRIEAEGIHNFVGADYDKLIPAWEQAKNFCQHRLKDQVGKMMLELLQRGTTATDNGVSPQTGLDLATLFSDQGLDGIYNLPSNFYKIYNETINVIASEANGTFSLEYSAIVKRFKTGAVSGLPADHDVIHTVVPNKTVSDAGSASDKTVNLTISGKIEGLVERNLLNGHFTLQDSPDEILKANDTARNTKYKAAKEYFQAICPSNQQLTAAYKNYYGITYSLFGVSCGENSGPVSSSLSVDHDFNEGVINYNVVFDGSRVCAGNSYYTNVDFVLEDKVEAIAEIVIPGRIAPGPLVQKLNTYKPRTITVNITGRANKDCCVALGSYAAGVCQPYSSFYPMTKNANDFTLDGILPPRAIANGALAEDSTNVNPLEGTFSVTRKYIYFDLDATT